MFQYAFGRGVSAALNRRLVFDLTMLPTGKPPHQRVLGLSRLPLHPSTQMIGKYGADAASGRARLLVNRSGQAVRSRLARLTVQEPDFDAIITIDDLPRPVALCIGYWQSPKYFDAISEDVRAELTPAINSAGKVYRILDATRSSARIAVHVRRGDYAMLPEVRAFHGLPQVAYYQRAVNALIEASAGPWSVIVLSDDPAWCERELHFPVTTIHAEIDGSLAPHEALALMSRCQHHVISNSSFSWWGAWLATSHGQEVLYPQRWIRSRPVDASFRFPERWRALTDDGGPT
jgi:hypothetical protein